MLWDIVEANNTQNTNFLNQIMEPIKRGLGDTNEELNARLDSILQKIYDRIKVNTVKKLDSVFTEEEVEFVGKFILSDIGSRWIKASFEVAIDQASLLESEEMADVKEELYKIFDELMDDIEP
jgi:hypothetical protein